MITIQGKGVSAGVGVGPLYYYRRATAEIKRYTVEDTDAEWHRFKGAQTGAVEQLGQLAEQARAEAGDEAAMLFETHQMMAEDLDYEDVDYWDELCTIMDYTKENVYSTIHLCWGALAGLYYHFGVRKVHLPEKMFGVFEHRVTRPSNPLVRGFDEVFYAPHSRHTGISREDVDNCKALRILAESDAAGPFLMSTENGRQIFVTGHPEYDKYTLDSEYRRDVDKGLPIHVPVNYYPDDDPTKPPLFRWRAHAHLLYENWLNYYVYQNTPYDLGEIQRVKHE